MTTDAPKTVIVDKFKTSCDGGGADGHPRIWLQIPTDQGWVQCPYCDCKFIHSDFAKKAS